MLDKSIKNNGDNSGAIVGENLGNVTNITNITNITNGTDIDEKRVREICTEMFHIMRREFTHDAYACAHSRVEKLEEILVPKMREIEGALNAFADPSFQFLLASAQKTAAATEREVDYELLSELLVNKITKSEERKVHASVARAVEIVDKIDNDALSALTTMYVIANLSPSSWIYTQGISTLKELYSKVSVNLPIQNIDWIDHLEVLGCVRINILSRLKKINQYLPEIMDGYFCVGIGKDSDEYKRAIALLNSVKLSSEILVDHELLDGFVRLPLVSKSRTSEVLLPVGHTEPIRYRQLTLQEVNIFYEIFDLYSNQDDKKKIVNDKFFEIWNEHESLKNVKEWWDSLPQSISLTSVGKVLANANANRLDANVPKVF